MRGRRGPRGDGADARVRPELRSRRSGRARQRRRRDVEFSGFEWGDANGWFEYRIEKSDVFRATYGNMWTQQVEVANRSSTTPDGPVTLPEIDESMRYGTVGVSYLFWEGFFTSGLFAGIGGYGIRPDPGRPSRSRAVRRTGTRRSSGGTRASTANSGCSAHLGVVLRFTYHNVSAHPHRQFVTADGGAVFRF